MAFFTPFSFKRNSDGAALSVAPFITPASLSPYDILKCTALLLMLCDHIGAYVFPLQDTWRIIGRLCVPIWIFLIGYARTRRIDTPLVAAALFISALQFMMLEKITALNILWSIIILRLTLNPLMRFIGHSDIRLYAVTFALVPLAVITRNFFEYGTMIWLLGIWGYLVRHGFPDATGKARPDIPLLYGVLVLVMFAVIETLSFDFNTLQAVFLALGLIPVGLGLAFYLPRDSRIGTTLPAGLRHITGFLARHTLGFYVIHVTILLLYKTLHPLL